MQVPYSQCYSKSLLCQSRLDKASVELSGSAILRTRGLVGSIASSGAFGDMGVYVVKLISSECDRIPNIIAQRSGAGNGLSHALDSARSGSGASGGLLYSWLFALVLHRAACGGGGYGGYGTTGQMRASTSSVKALLDS